MVSWSVVPGRCPWCQSDRETIYTSHGQKICGTCAIKLSQAFIRDVIEPERKRIQKSIKGE